jgi:hypothetical protein
MGWGSIAEKLNRIIGGYSSDEKVAEKLEAKAEPKVEATRKEQPPKPMAHPVPEAAKPSDDPMKWVPPNKNSIYDVPAITRESVPVEGAPVKTSRPRRARKPKQESAPKEQVAVVAT